MMMVARPISFQVAPALLVLCLLFAAGNWYLQPERAVVWGARLALVGCMTLVLGIAVRLSRNSTPGPRTADSLKSAIVFATGMLAVSLGARLATTLGAVEGADFSRRATMVTLGAFLAFTGNAMPKTLTPLSALQCDGARLQAFQRFAGWTWVLTGLAFAGLWLVVAVDVAKPVSVLVLVGGMLVIAVQVVRLRLAPRRNATPLTQKEP